MDNGNRQKEKGFSVIDGGLSADKPAAKNVAEGVRAGIESQSASESPAVGWKVPKFLDGVGRAKFLELREQLAAGNVVLDRDRHIVTLLAHEYSVYRKLSADVQARGATYECRTKSGDTMQRINPAETQRGISARMQLRILQELYMTPRSRGGAPDPEAPKQQTLDGFLDGD